MQNPLPEANSLFPPLPRTTSLAIYDLRAIDPDLQFSIATLAGLVNRGAEKIYLLENADDEFWLNELDPSLPRTRPPVAGGNLLTHLLSIYRSQIEGLVLYDPALPATRNVASTLASLRAGLVVSPAQAGALQNAPYDLPILADLRVYGWKTPLQAYTWACKNLLPQCSSTLVAGLNPSVRCCLRSFLVTQRVFTYWLDPRKFLPSPSSGWLSERGLLKRIFAHYAPGTHHLGWFISEPFGVDLASRAAILTLASDYCTNLAVWSSLPAPTPSEASASTVADLSDASSIPETGEPDQEHKTYLSFTVSDGDNLQYCQHHLLRLWQDPARGKLPLGWTIAPALQQVMPELAAFYRRTATEHDEFIAGPSGAAYLFPSRLPGSYRVAFLRQTAEAMQSMHLTLLQVLDSSTLFSMKFLRPELQKSFVAQLAPYGLRGIFSGAGSLSPSWRFRSGLPIYQNLGLATNTQRTLDLIRHTAARGQRFINVYISAWHITPGDLQRIVEQLDETFCVVTPGRLLDLVGNDLKREQISYSGRLSPGKPRQA